MKKLIALRHVRISLNREKHYLKKGDKIPSEKYKMTDSDLEILARSSAFEQFVEKKSKK